MKAKWYATTIRHAAPRSAWRLCRRIRVPRRTIGPRVRGRTVKVGTFGKLASELAQEPDVVLPEQADVVDRVQEHGDPLRSHTEREAAHLVGVVTAVSEHGGMHHAGAHDLEPAGA